MSVCPRCQRLFADSVRYCPVDGAPVPSPEPDLRSGQVLMDQFELCEVVGQGAMGTVYRAYQRTMDRVVAVKLLRAELVKGDHSVRRFLREARAAARLQHPNIVTVHLVGETSEGIPYLVMEYVDGTPLEQLCASRTSLPLQRALHITRQIALALAQAHGVGIVHRDLKPANVLVSEQPCLPDLVKVFDFGIAKIVHDEADSSWRTTEGTIFGTPDYIAPEQASGGTIDGRADLYSLGCLLFRLTTGRLPFEGTHAMQVLLQHLRDEPPSPRAFDPAIPPRLEELILRLLAKSPEGRPADADEVIAALDRLALTQPLAASTEPAGPGTSSSWRLTDAAGALPGPSALGECQRRPQASGSAWSGWLLAIPVVLLLSVGGIALRRRAVEEPLAPPAEAPVATAASRGWAPTPEVPRADPRPSAPPPRLPARAVVPSVAVTPPKELPLTIIPADPPGVKVHPLPSSAPFPRREPDLGPPRPLDLAAPGASGAPRGWASSAAFDLGSLPRLRLDAGPPVVVDAAPPSNVSLDGAPEAHGGAGVDLGPSSEGAAAVAPPGRDGGGPPPITL